MYDQPTKPKRKRRKVNWENVIASTIMVFILIGGAIAIGMTIHHDNIQTGKRIKDANALVERACGKQRQQEFRLVTKGTSSYDQIYQAREWATDCFNSK